MKRILHILFAAIAIVSCEQEEFPGSGLESLRDFTLNPVPGSRIALNSLKADENIVMSWQVSRSGFDSPVTYTWMLDEEGGNFSSPILSLPSDNNGLDNKLTISNAMLEEKLKNAGVPAGGELKGVWSVKATNGDVTKVATHHALAIMRFSEAIMSFELTDPVNGETIFLKESLAASTINMTWESTLSGLGTTVKYEWLLDLPDGDFSNPVLTMSSDNNGVDSKLSITHQQLEDALEELGVDPQSLAEYKWTVKATAGEAEQFADEAFALKLVRWGTEVRLRIPLLPALTPTDKDVYAAGEFGFLGASYSNWQQPGTNAALKLTKESDNSYYLDINVPKGHTFQYKFTLATAAAPTWEFGEQKFNAAGDGCEGMPNRSFTFGGDNDLVNHTVQSWEKFCPYDVVEVTFELKNYADVPDGYSVYLAGAFGDLGVTTGNWNEPGSNPDLKMTLGADNVYRKKFAVSKGLPSTTIQYKYFLVPDGGTSWGYGEQSFSSTACQGLYNGAEGTDNRKYTFTVGDGSAKTVEANVVTWEGFCVSGARARFEVTVPANTPSNKDVYITGGLGFLTWAQPGTAPALRMRLVPGHTDKYEIYLPVPQGQQIEFKFFLATTESPAWGNGEQKFNAGNTACEGIANRTFTFNGTNEFSGTVISWEGYCPL
jgi:hypothetical protein